MQKLLRLLRWWFVGGWPTAIAMGIVVVYYFASWGAFQGKAAGDGWFGFLYLRAIVLHRSLDMVTVAPEFLRFFGTLGPGHHMPNRCPIGPVFLWLPFYLLALGVELAGHALRLLPPNLGTAPRLEIVITGVGTLVVVLLGWRALVVLVRRHLGLEAAAVTGVAVLLATPMLWYTANHPFYQHGPAFGFVCLLIEYWDRTRGRADVRRFAILGALGGAAMLMRVQEALFLLLPALEVASHLRTGPDRRRWLSTSLACPLTAAICFSPQLGAWYYYTGNPFTAPQPELFRWAQPFVATTLFSTRAGFFPWTPIAYAGLFGVAWALLRPAASEPLRFLLGALLVVMAIDVYAMSCAWVLCAGFTYGARRLTDCAPLLAIGTAVLYSRLRTRVTARRVLVGFVAFCVLANVLLTELLRRQKIHGSGAEARAFATVIEDDLHAPPWLVSAFSYVGYPFSAPANWLFALAHRVRPAVWEAVDGNFLLDRDAQWNTVLNNRLLLDWSHRWYAVSGLQFARGQPAEVTGPVKLLLPMFQEERIRVTVVGPSTRPSAARWNGVPVPATARPGSLDLVVPREHVRAGTNELALELPAGARIERLDFASIDGRTR